MTDALTPDEEARWHAFVARWEDRYPHARLVIADELMRPDAWPRRFHLWRFWR